jgi:hypothetical protein
LTSVEAAERPPKKCRFAGACGCTNPLWMSKAFSDRRAPEETKKIIKDNKMFSFCLLHGTDDVCFAKMTNTKPPCPMPECNKQHIRWLHEILLLESTVILIRQPVK